MFPEQVMLAENKLSIILSTSSLNLPAYDSIASAFAGGTHFLP